MIKNKVGLLSSIIILCICMFLYFPYPSNVTFEARSMFMSFPMSNKDGLVFTGIIGSVLFIIAIVLLWKSLKKYQLRTIVIVAILYTILPHLLITIYQETLASGIMAVSYDHNGNCNFQEVREDLLSGECTLVLNNRSNESVSFELEFLESHYYEDEMRAESLMNLAGPYYITIEANNTKSIHLKELLDVSDVPKHIEGGASTSIHFKIIDDEATRIL